MDKSQEGKGRSRTAERRRKEAVPVHSRGRKGSGSRADWLSLCPSSSPTGQEHSLARPLLPDTLAGTMARQPAQGGRPSPAQDGPT